MRTVKTCARVLAGGALLALLLLGITVLPGSSSDRHSTVPAPRREALEAGR